MPEGQQPDSVTRIAGPRLLQYRWHPDLAGSRLRGNRPIEIIAGRDRERTLRAEVFSRSKCNRQTHQTELEHR